MACWQQTALRARIHAVTDIPWYVMMPQDRASFNADRNPGAPRAHFSQRPVDTSQEPGHRPDAAFAARDIGFQKS
jgi:hypothetical protein